MKHRVLLNKSLLFIGITILYFAAVANPKAPHIVNAGKGICTEDWVKKIEQDSSVRLEYEFLDNMGNVVPADKAPFQVNPMQFCSGNLVRVGPEKKVKFVTAGHCIKDKYRKEVVPQKSVQTGVQQGVPPIEAYNVRLVARVGGKDPAITLSGGMGPEVMSDLSDIAEVYRKNDFVISGSSSHNLDTLFSGKSLPELCDPNMTKEDIKKAAVVGYGITNNNAVSKTPLCAEQKIKSIQDGIITIEPYKKDSPGACPGDSGGGLWILPNNSTKPCLSGVVSGPRTASLQTRSPETYHQWSRGAIEQCTKPGVEAIFSSVYQQQDLINGYLQINPSSMQPALGEKIQ